MISKNQGITLVALVITVIVLIILAGVTLSTLIGDNGIITKAIEAKQNMENASREEEELLQNLLDEMNKIEGEENNEELLPPDEGKEELILEYTVDAGDTIELPYSIVYMDVDVTETEMIDNIYEAKYSFDIDWGDGVKEEGINNENIVEKSTHTYSNSGKYNIKIKGKFECICNFTYVENGDNIIKKGKDKLTQIKQWGTTGIKNVLLGQSLGLSNIAQPTQNTFKDLCYVDFAGCSSLEEIPEALFANCTKIEYGQGIFGSCENLKIIPKNLFANCENIKTFSLTFAYCKNIKEIQEDVFKNCKNVYDFTYTFMFCDSLTNIPEDLFSDCKKAKKFYATFQVCNNIKSLPEGLFKNNINVETFGLTFYMCHGLTTIPENIFENCNKVNYFAGTFADCTNLIGKVPKLWLRVPDGENNEYKGVPDGKDCFKGCTKLDNYSDIPEYWGK